MIHLLDDYYVSVDGGSYTLLKKVNGKTKNGEPTERKDVIGYYGSLRHCLKRCASELLESEINGRIVELKEAINMINENVNRLEKLFERGGVE